MNTFNPNDFSSPVEEGGNSNAGRNVVHALHEAEAHAKLEAGKDHAAQAARELKEGAMLKAREVKDNAVHKVDDVRRRVETSVQDARSRCERSTREDPMRSLLYAFGAGFVIGFIFRG